MVNLPLMEIFYKKSIHLVWLTLEGRLPEHWHSKDTCFWPEFSLSPRTCLCHGSFCSWESHNSLWLTPARALGSPCRTCRGGLELIEDLRKTGIVYFVNCCKFRQRQTLLDQSTQISESCPSVCLSLCLSLTLAKLWLPYPCGHS